MILRSGRQVLSLLQSDGFHDSGRARLVAFVLMPQPDSDERAKNHNPQSLGPELQSSVIGLHE